MADTFEDIWLDRRVNIGYETAEELAKKFNEDNWRGHPEAQAEAVDESLEALHWIGSVKVNIQTGRMFDGHLRVKRALVKNPSMRIPVDYYDLSPDEELLALQIHDAITEQAEPIPDKLAALLERTRAMTAERPGLKGMLDKLKERTGIGVNGNESKDVEPKVDKAAELQKVWGTAVGQIWQLGNHRLAVGDCTDRAVVEAVMKGERAKLYATDPPYGVAYGVETGADDIGYNPIANDENDGPKLQEFLENAFRIHLEYLESNTAWYLWHAQMTQGFFAAAAAAADVIIHRQIIWVKPSLILGHGDYHWRHELCFYGWRRGNRPDWYGDRAQTTVWEVGRENDGVHPTQKPVGLFERPLYFNTRPEEIAFEPFCGSGTQIIACENLGRKCRAIELDPGYAAVSIQRFFDATGIDPHLLSG